MGPGLNDLPPAHPPRIAMSRLALPRLVPSRATRLRAVVLTALCALLWLALLWLAPGAVAQPAAAPHVAAAPTLYQRLGGYDALAAVTDAFVGRLVQDPELGRFFGGHGAHSLARIRQLVIEQLCAATGGPCLYTGRDMRTTHAGMGITEAQWDRSVGHFVATLDQFAVPEAERAEVLAIVGPLKDDIVDRPAAGH
jgi:hemoglobin